VSAAAYQHIFGRMVASPAFRAALVERPDDTLAGVDLTDRERRRLLAIAVQPGMRVNTAIHRANRLTPIEQTLPFTCVLLGERLGGVVDRYWDTHPTENLQAPAECERFATFLLDEIRRGAIADRYLEDVIGFERACTALRFHTGETTHAPASLPALVRVVRFTHNPVPVLEALGELRRPPDDVPAGVFYLVVDCRGGEPQFRLLDQDAVAAFRARGWV